MKEIYSDFYGFDSKPFNVTPDPEFIYYSDQHKEALAHMVYGVEERKGFILVTGRVGTGKTTLCRAFLRELDDSTKTALVLNTTVNFHELLLTIAEDFGLELPADPSNKQIIDRLNEFVLAEYRAGRNVCLIIDESQNLSPEVLENFRLLSNLETDKEKLLQIVLVGQPELDSILSQERLRQLKQRVAVRSHLSNLSREETRHYVLHRLNQANPDKPVRVNRGIFQRLFEVTSGNPRAINLVCDRMLMAAYVDNSFTLNSSHLERGAEDLIEQKEQGEMEINDTRLIRRLRKIIRRHSFLEAIGGASWWLRSAAALVVTLALGTGLFWLTGFNFYKFSSFGGVQDSKLSTKLQEAAQVQTESADTAPVKEETKNRKQKRARKGDTVATRPVVPNPLGVTPLADAGNETGGLQLQALARLVSYEYGRRYGSSPVDEVQLNFNSQQKLGSVIPEILPGRVIELVGGPRLILNSGFPAFLRWQNSEASRRYVLHIPGYEKLWDPVNGWLDLDLETIQNNWPGRGKIVVPRNSIQPGQNYGRGRSGPPVKKIQELLNRAGDSIPTVGHYGPQTTEAVEEFQRKNNLPVDGIVGLRTLIFLFKAADAQKLDWQRKHFTDFIGRFTGKSVSDKRSSR